MRAYNPRKDNPEHSAYFDGQAYHCLNIDCWRDGAKLEECGRLRLTDGVSYIPLLRCEECETVYFGLTHKDRTEIEAYHECVEKDNAERSRVARADQDESIEEIKAAQKKEEIILRSEVEKHEAEIDGDIILPNLLTF